MGTVPDRVEERRRAVQLARHYREAEGLSIAQIAQRLGRSPATVKAYFYDPTGEPRLRRPTQPRNGKGDAYAHCTNCHPGASAPKWTRERVRDAIRARRDRYGEPPSSYDWSRTHARRRGGQALARLAGGDWPAPPPTSPKHGRPHAPNAFESGPSPRNGTSQLPLSEAMRASPAGPGRLPRRMTWRSPSASARHACFPRRIQASARITPRRRTSSVADVSSRRVETSAYQRSSGASARVACRPLLRFVQLASERAIKLGAGGRLLSSRSSRLALRSCLSSRARVPIFRLGDARSRARGHGPTCAAAQRDEDERRGDRLVPLGGVPVQETGGDAEDEQCLVLELGVRPLGEVVENPCNSDPRSTRTSCAVGASGWSSGAGQGRRRPAWIVSGRRRKHPFEDRQPQRVKLGARDGLPVQHRARA
jgi:AraC-like DNA-binding protein